MASLTQTQFPQAPDSEISTLIEKHRVEIDQVKMMDSQHQQEVFSALGVDPGAIAAHYPELQKQSDELRRRDKVASRETAAVGVASLGAGIGGAIALDRKFSIGSKIVKWFAIPIAGIATGLAGTFAGSRLFSGNIREQGKELAIQANAAFERELAVALENKEREAVLPVPAAPAAIPCKDPAALAPEVQTLMTQAATDKAVINAAETQLGQTAAPETGFAAQVAAEKSAPAAPRDPSFAAQAANDKAAAASAEAQRG